MLLMGPVFAAAASGGPVSNPAYRIRMGSSIGRLLPTNWLCSASARGTGLAWPGTAVHTQKHG